MIDTDRRVALLSRAIQRHREVLRVLEAEYARLNAMPVRAIAGPWRGRTNVVVSMPFHGCHQWVRRAVESILDQTHRDLTLVVVNDADPVPPWDLLDDIHDPRLVRFDLLANHGRYFADAVIFDAFHPDWWAMQDPDDWAEPDRLELMLGLAQAQGMAVGGSRYLAENAAVVRHSGELRRAHGKTVEVVPRVWPAPMQMKHYVGYGAAVIAGERIRTAGGFHPEIRLSFDTYLMNALRLTGGMGILERPLQNKLFRDGSLQTADETKQGTPQRTRAQRRLRRLYTRARELHRQGRPIAGLVKADCNPLVWADMKQEAARLRAQVQEVAA